MISGSKSENSETLHAFQSGFLGMDVDAYIEALNLNANIAFYQVLQTGTIRIHAVYCYTCVDKIINIKLDFQIPSIWMVFQLSKFVNRHNHGQGGITYGSIYGAGLRRTFSTESCGLSQGLILFYKNISECIEGEFVGLVVAAKHVNSTINEFRKFGDEKRTLDGFRLNIVTTPHFQPITQQTISIYRWKTAFVGQKSNALMYCKSINAIISKDWTIYFTALSWEVWAIIVVILLIYGIVIFKSIMITLDLIRPIFGSSLGFKYPGYIISVFLAGALFLSSFYNAGISTQFMFSKDTDTLQTYFKQNYKIYFSGLDNIDTYASMVSERQKLGLEKMSQMKTAREAFYADKNFVFTYHANKKLDYMVKYKLLLLVSDSSKFLFPSVANILNIVDKAVVKDDYICGRLKVPEYAIATYKSIYKFWGVGSDLVYAAYRNLAESGFLTQTENLIVRQFAFQQKISWSELSNFLGRPVPFGIDSPLGYACVLYFALLLAFGTTYIPMMFSCIFRALSCATTFMRELREINK